MNKKFVLLVYCRDFCSDIHITCIATKQNKMIIENVEYNRVVFLINPVEKMKVLKFHLL